MSRNILMQVVFSIVVLWVATHFTRQAKAQATNGIISGTVIDASGAAVPGVTIQVKNVNTGVTRTVLTNEQGRYRVPDLLVGAYEVQGALPGFQTVVQRGIPLTVGSERVVDFSLQVGQPETTVTVEGEIAQVDTTSTAIASLIEQKQIADLPLNGRNYTQLIALAPGVQQAAPGTSGFYGRGANFSVAGARPEGQAFLLDNTNVQDFWNHGPGSAVLGTTLGVEAIAEFSTQTNTYGAQFGGAGAAINAVTRSGTNQFHGSVFEYFRNSVLDARGPFDGPKLPTFRQNQFGASLGGPIRKDKTFFFANYEGLRRGLGLTRVTFVPDANAHNGILPGLNPIPLSPLIQQLLTYYPIPNNSVGGGLGRYSVVATQVGNEDYVLGRVDHMISATDSVFARYIRDRADFTDPFSGSNLPLWPETHRTGNHYATIEERHIVSSAVVNLARFSFVRTREGSNLNDNLPGLSFYPNVPDCAEQVLGGRRRVLDARPAQSPNRRLRRTRSVERQCSRVVWWKLVVFQFGELLTRKSVRISWALARTGRCLSRLPRNRRRRLCTGRVASAAEADLEPWLAVQLCFESRHRQASAQCHYGFRQRNGLCPSAQCL
ncbi:MAG: hypothetical protein DMG17_33210 [Acidobacteria bacterium]|nr:MAG: hypothetical protein DMG17_33210 [Acidobacteriota bacterium]